MTKQIETLVDDLNSILLNGLGRDVTLVKDQEAIKTFITSCGDALSEVLKGLNTKGRRELRMSNIGLPDRKLWYAVNGSSKKRSHLTWL